MTSDTTKASIPEIAGPAGGPQTHGASARRPVSGAVTVARRSVSVARRGTANIIARVPATLRTTRAGAQEATNVLQGLPDATLRTLAASSLGLGAGFYLRGAPRLVIMAGVVPAMIMGATIALRPVAPLVPNGADR
jgi:hypothetical protein